MPSVVKVGLDPKRPVQYRSTTDDNGIITDTGIQYWRVVFDSPLDDPHLVLGATDGTHTVPIMGDAWFGSTDPLAPSVYDLNPQLDPTSANKQYILQVSFSNKNKTTATGKWDVQVSFDGIPIQESMWFDLDNNSITNSAGQPLTTQPNQTYYDTAVKIGFKTDSFDETDAEALRGFVNSESITLTISALGYSRVFPAKTLKLENFTSTPTVQLGSLAFWQVSLNFTYRPLHAEIPNLVKPDGSGDAVSGSISTLEYDPVADVGFTYWNDTPKLVHFLNDDTTSPSYNQPLNDACPLDGQGGNGRTSGHPTAGSTYFLAYRVASEGDFSPLFTGIS